MADTTVLISTRNRAARLHRTLGSLAQQRLPTTSRWEVLVVDDGGEDATGEVLAEWVPCLPLRTIRTEGVGKSAALNLALAETSTPLLLFTDDDVTLPPNWLASYRAATDAVPEAGIFGGAVFPEFPDGTPDWIQSDRFPFAAPAFAHYCPQPDSGFVSSLPFGPNYAVHRDRVAPVVFDERIGPQSGPYRMGQESRMLEGLVAQGARCYFIAGIGVRHHVRDDQVSLAWLEDRCHNAGYSTYRAKHAQADRRQLQRVLRRERLRLLWSTLCGIGSHSPNAGERSLWRLRAARSRGRVSAVSDLLAGRQD